MFAQMVKQNDVARNEIELQKESVEEHISERDGRAVLNLRSENTTRHTFQAQRGQHS